MKKIYRLLLFLGCVLITPSIAFAVPAALDVTPSAAGIMQNTSGVYNQMQINQMKDYRIEKNLISPVETLTPPKDEEEKFEVDVQKDLVKDGVIYNPKFMVRKINFEGNTKIKSKVLNSLADDIIDHEIYFEDLLTFALRVSRYYQSKGYLTSYAYIPAQQIVDGQVTVSIVESTIDEVDISGNKWARKWYLKNVVMGRDGLREGTVFNAKALQGSLRELNEEKYIKAQSTISKNGDNTKVELNISVTI